MLHTLTCPGRGVVYHLISFFLNTARVERFTCNNLFTYPVLIVYIFVFCESEDVAWS